MEQGPIKPMELRQVGTTDVVLAPSGYLTGYEIEEHQEFYNYLSQLEVNPRDCIVNLERVQHLNSFALSKLMAAETACAKSGKHLRLCCTTKRIENIFIMTKLSLFFGVFTTEAAAIDYCNNPTKESSDGD